MIRNRFPAQLFDTNLCWCWMLLVGVGLLVDTDGLECYECDHVTSVQPLFPGIFPDNPDCINPTSTNKVNKTTCPDPGDSCIKIVADADVGIANITSLKRACYPSTSGQVKPDVCTDFAGVGFANHTVVIDGSFITQRFWSDVMDSDEFKAKNAQTRQQANLIGKYCSCHTDFCNDAPGMEVVFINGPNSNSTTIPPTAPTPAPDPDADGGPIQKAFPQLVLFLLIFGPSAFFNTNQIMMKITNLG